MKCDECGALTYTRCVECLSWLCDECANEGCCGLLPADLEDTEEPGEPDYNAVSGQEQAEMAYNAKYYGR